MIKALQLCLIIALIGSASAAAATCAALPAMEVLEAFAALATGTDTEKAVFTDAMTAVKAVSGSGAPFQISSSNADMAYCTSVKSGVDTCCVVDTETAIKALLLRHYKLRMEKLPLSLGNLKNVIDASSKCIGKTVAEKIVTAMATQITTQETARVAGIKAEINWLRGQACAICQSTAEADYVYKAADKQFQVKAADIKSYTDAMKASNKQFNDSNVDLQKLIEDTLTAEAKTCTKVLEDATKSFTDNAYTVAHSDVDCTTSTVYGAAVDTQYGGCIRFQEYGYDSTKTITAGFKVDDTNALDMWVTNTADDTEFDAIASTYKTNVVAALPAMIAKDDTKKDDTKKDDTKKDDDDDSSSSVLYVSALLALFLVLL